MNATLIIYLTTRIINGNKTIILDEQRFVVQESGTTMLQAK